MTIRHTVAPDAPIKSFSKVEISPYAFFVFTFIGFNFYDKKRRKTMTKMQMYYADKERAAQAARAGEAPKGFELTPYIAPY